MRIDNEKLEKLLNDKHSRRLGQRICHKLGIVYYLVIKPTYVTNLSVRGFKVRYEPELFSLKPLETEYTKTDAYYFKRFYKIVPSKAKNTKEYGEFEVKH